MLWQCLETTYTKSCRTSNGRTLAKRKREGYVDDDDDDDDDDEEEIDDDLAAMVDDEGRL
jgi:hypothetical protein